MKRPPLCGCCSPSNLRAVTIKGIDKTDGTTVWEYGPGAFWRHHYGADAISGVVPNLSATLDKYAIGARAFPSYADCGNRNTATLDANSAEAVTLTKLDSLDGTVIESATLTGFFCDTIAETFVGMMNGLSITNAAALSGGDYVIVGQRLPFIEFVDFASNTVNKEYILHAHGNIGGNVYLKTRTSSETITIPYNSTAAEVETLFEATSDCVAATATGGPWPLKAIAIDVEWSVSSGDISGIAMTGTQSATGGGADWSSSTGEVSPGIDYLTLSVASVSIGTTFEFSFAIGATFKYVSETDDVSAFLSAMEGAMEAFALAQGSDGAWEYVALGIPVSIQVSGSDISVLYSTELGFDPLTVELTANGEPTTDSRRVESCAASYDTGTGEMMSSVGYQFGYSAGAPPTDIFEETASAPSITGLNVLGISSIGSGPSNSVIVTPFPRGSGDTQKASVVEAWTISSGVWSQNWNKYCNASMAMPEIILCESGYICCPIRAKRFDGVRDRNAARIAVADAAIVELLTNFASINYPNNISLTAMYDDTPGSYLTWGYNSQIVDTDRPNNVFRTNTDGSDTYVDGSLLRLGAVAFGADATTVFGISYVGVTQFAYVPETTIDHSFTIRFWPEPTARSAEPQQFRFRFANNTTTGWIDWYATTAEIVTELLALLGENSDPTGFGSNVQVIFSDIEVDNVPVAAIERGLWFQFLTTNGVTSGSGYVPAAYLSTRPGDVSIEIQTSTPFATPGIAAYDITTADLTWSRAWGTSGARTISQPLYAWLQGDFVYAFGNVVDTEL